MKGTECTSTTADEAQHARGMLSLPQAIEVLQHFPWDAEVAKAQTTHCFPTVGYHKRSSANGKNDYLNITGYDPGRFSVMIEVFIPRKILGFIPSASSCFSDQSALALDQANAYLSAFYQLPTAALVDWIKHAPSASQHP